MIFACVSVMKLIKAALILGLTAVLTFSTEAGDMIMTYGDPGVTGSSVGNVSVFNFDSLSLGVHSNVPWSGVGSFDALSIAAANLYGGAADAAYPNGSPYAIQSTSGALGGVSRTTLTLSTPSSYFGMWWSAGDSANVWTFYSGGNQIAQFNVANVTSALPAAYFGNPTPGPNHGADAREAFAFINFYGYAGTTFDRIVMSNPQGSGFEYDNVTVRVGAYGTNPGDRSTLPGVPVSHVVNNGAEIVFSPSTPAISTQPVPEPAVFPILALAGLGALSRLIKIRK